MWIFYKRAKFMNRICNLQLLLSLTKIKKAWRGENEDKDKSRTVNYYSTSELRFLVIPTVYVLCCTEKLERL